MKKNSGIRANIWKFYFAKFFGSLEFIAPIFVLFLLANNLSMTEVMILQSFFTIIIFIFEVPSGAFADRFGLKRTLILSYLMIALAFILYGLVYTFLGFLIAEFFFALGISLISGTASAFLYDTLRQIKRQHHFKKVLGRAYALEKFAIAISSVGGGIIAFYVNMRVTFFIGAFFILLGLLFFIWTKEPKPYKAVLEKNYFTHLRQGTSYALKHKKIRSLLAYYTLIGGITFVFFFLIQPYFFLGDFSLKWIGAGFGIFFFLEGIAFLYADFFLKKYKNHYSILKATALCLAIGYFFLYIMPFSLGAIIILLLMAMLPLKELIIEHEVNKESTTTHRATILSVTQMGKNIFHAALGPIIGYVADIFSLKEAILLLAILAFISYLLTFLLFRDEDF